MQDGLLFASHYLWALRTLRPPLKFWMDRPVKGPDGMRAANGKLLLAENGSGRISVVTVNGDKATVTVIKEGLKTPTAVEPAGGMIWIAERGAGKAPAQIWPSRVCSHLRSRDQRKRLVRTIFNKFLDRSFEQRGQIK